MARSAAAHLEEIYKACTYILTRIDNVTQEEYLDNVDLRFAIERNVIIIGEALAVIRRGYPEISARIQDLSKIVDFRNFVVHQYLDLDNEQVWGILHTKIGPLKASVELLIEEFEDS
jgi:uncharacterized protein with HEPN domain